MGSCVTSRRIEDSISGATFYHNSTSGSLVSSSWEADTKHQGRPFWVLNKSKRQRDFDNTLNNNFQQRSNDTAEMTCPLPPSHSITYIPVPTISFYTRNFHTPIFKRVTVVNTVSVVVLPAPLKIIHK